ncbi:MAG: SpoVA/SpoVAEb family sporulation membrane protein [Firmicutes bacterium]|nr:SpoVA/SpoVAEb family sporulation membrane protein [Bacillota bacterium]
MNKEEYKKLIAKKKPKETRAKNALISFVVGGTIGVSGELVSHLMMMSFGVSKATSYMLVCLILIFGASLLTALGKFDDWVKKGKCGLIVPTTGFAHSVTSAAMEYRKDGLITGLGANFFKLAGSVILYGIVSAFFLCLLKVVIYG